MLSFSLHGKRALITGGSGGIGSSIARTLSQEGAAVTIVGTNVTRLQSIALEIGCDYIVADVSKDVQSIYDKSGDMDIVINNAGVTRDSLSIRMQEQDWDDVININLKAAFMISQAFVRSMIKKRSGRIIFISSVVASTGNIGQANYCASKAGLEGLCRSLAKELASRDITVNCVAPGLIDTEMTRHINKENFIDKIPLKRCGTPEDIANLVAFLVSPMSSYITGQVIHVNGGMY